MGNLKNPKWIYLKGYLFALICLASAGLLIMENPAPRTFFLVGMVIWASARSYYFAFYVIEHYVDQEYRFSGLVDFCRYFWHGPQPQNRRDHDESPSRTGGSLQSHHEHPDDPHIP